MNPVPLTSIFIERAVAETEMAATIRRNACGIPVRDIPSWAEEAERRGLDRTTGKRVLVVRRFQGRFFKQCQGFKQEYSCCNLQTVGESHHCALDCTYCILQYYMTAPHLSVFANTGDMEAEIAREVAAQPERFFRVTTGELGDSLLLDPLTGASRRWVAFFRNLPNAVLELKTKTVNIGNLLGLDSGRKTVVSWSVNPSSIVAGEEFRTATVDERLAAASRVSREGYPVGFHLDPLVNYADWRRDYMDLLDSLLDAVKPEGIAWISLGCLRFPPELKPTLATRFPGSRLRLGELVLCADGKMRYPRPLRLEMYGALVGHLRERFTRSGSPPLVYLCMEPPDVWRRVFGEPGPTSEELDLRFAGTYRRRFR